MLPNYSHISRTQFILFCCCSKQEFVDSFSRALAFEYAPQGIEVQV